MPKMLKSQVLLWINFYLNSKHQEELHEPFQLPKIVGEGKFANNNCYAGYRFTAHFRRNA